MTFGEFRRRADAVRGVPLECVLLVRDAVRDRQDRSKWHTEQGVVSVTGTKFTNWQRVQAGGGAIDLVMHLAGVDASAAVGWLEQHFAASHLVAGGGTPASSHESPAVEPHRTLRLPAPEDRMRGQIQRYLTQRRHLSTPVIRQLIGAGKLYGDSRGNAVLLLVAGKANHPVGAELRGTGSRVWRGMAPGSRKDLGYFWVGARGANEIVLCESAIDAISCYQQHAERICISTSGVRANPRWLRGLIAHGYRIHCGFDADEAGEAGASAMMALHPDVTRLRPPAHDWNDALAASAGT